VINSTKTASKEEEKKKMEERRWMKLVQLK